MLVILPLLVWILLFDLSCRQIDWRKGFMIASATWALLLAVFTELSSLAHAFTATTVAIQWAFACLVLLVVRLRMPRQRYTLNWPKLSLIGYALLAMAGSLALLSFVAALLSPPNTWDSLVYHMARVVHWIQNRGVEHYPTSIDRQLWCSPFAEFVIAHFQLLSGGDRFAAMVQWFSYLGSAMTASYIASQLRVGTLGQLFSALFVLTIPLATLQATSTQNDLVLSFWLLCSLAFLIDWWQSEKRKACTVELLFFAITLALAVMTKGTAYILGFSLLLTFVILAGMRYRLACWKPLVIAGTICVVLNLGHWVRNTRLYGTPLTPPELSLMIQNNEISVRVTVSNIVRSAAFQVRLPSATWNDWNLRFVDKFHRGIGIDKSDWRTSFAAKPFEAPSVSAHDGRAPNFLHFCAAVGTWGLVFVVPGFRKNRILLVYTLGLATGFLLLCVLLKWHLGTGRFLMTLLIGSAPLAALLCERFVSPRWILAFSTLLFGSACVFMTTNTDRPLLPLGESVLSKPRSILAFSYFDSERETYSNAIEVLRNLRPEKLGVVFGPSGLEYSWLATYPTDEIPLPRIEHVLLDSQTLWVSHWVVAPDPPHPDAILVFRELDEVRTALQEQKYELHWQQDNYSIWVPAGEQKRSPEESGS